ncbi:MAG: membrane protein insertase YidC [Bacteroidetes bacterium]|jgi:YidC/Oxa1 family membrane protein insertase|nr:membrane protein insertase YidC [Bacteroidota bacterium]
MERTQTLGFVLIFVVLVAWIWLNTPPPAPPDQRTATAQVDSAAPKAAPSPLIVAPRDTGITDKTGRFFRGRDNGTPQTITIETDLFRAELSTKGASIKSWELKGHDTWDRHPVQMVDRSSGDFGILFGTMDGKTLSSRDLFFNAAPGARSVRLDANNFEFEIIFTLPASNGGALRKVYRFRNDRHGADVRYEFADLGSVIANYEYQITWDRGVPFAERNSVDEAGHAAAYAYAGSELTKIDASSIGEPVSRSLGGRVDWVAMRNKYFGVAFIPQGSASEGAVLEGHRTTERDNGVLEHYEMALRMPYTATAVETASVRLFIGPLDIDVLRSYGVGLESIMSLGWTWLIRPIAEWAFLPLFRGIHYFIPNWGMVIILFSLIVKVLLHPLTRASMKSMKKMQSLQPLMEEIKEKHKDDPAKMNQAVMNLYKEYGVNPAGGCLPILLQLPIMYALFVMFQSIVELRHAEFVWWITDLSVPDVLFTLPFHVPLFGFSEVSGIALLMGITMFVQQKMTVKDPRQKMMVWLMPIMMTLLFNSFPSGLNLYYTVFNVLSIGQQMWTNRQDDEPLRKVEPKKKRGGGIFRYAKDMPRLKR